MSEPAVSPLPADAGKRAPTQHESILVVDDDDTFRERLVRGLRTRGLDARGAADPATALALAREDSFEFALVDLRMPGGNGLDVVAACAKSIPPPASSCSPTMAASRPLTTR